MLMRSNIYFTPLIDDFSRVLAGAKYRIILLGVVESCLLLDNFAHCLSISHKEVLAGMNNVSIPYIKLL